MVQSRDRDFDEEGKPDKEEKWEMEGCGRGW